MARKTPPAPTRAASHLHATDARAAAQLATQAVLGITSVVEGVHQSVWGSVGIPGGKAAGSTRGLTALVYRAIRGITTLVGHGADRILRQLTPLLVSAQAAPAESAQRVAVVAAINGVLGDHLAAHRNPLALPMTLRLAGQVLQWKRPETLPQATNVSGHIVLLIHGLCMNDLQWRVVRPDGSTIDHGCDLASALGATPLYVRYNTGLHTSENGRLLCAQLARLAAHWPVPVIRITVVAHSMGGLVIRSAVHQAMHSRSPLQRAWLPMLKDIVFLGTPHHGAPLERAGNWVDVLLGSTPYSRPFAALGQLRSAGITDLRYGHVLKQDWFGHDRFHRKPDTRTPLPLPQGIHCYTVAATLAGIRSPAADRLLGDGLVPLPSALGQHADPKYQLKFRSEDQYVINRTGHLAMLSSPEVGHQLHTWMVPRT